MNKYILFLPVFILFSLTTANSQFYPVSKLPDSLKLNASLVIRSETRSIELKSVNSGTEKIVRILTILNKKGEDLAYLQLYYDKNSTIKVNEISYFNAVGEKIRSVKQSEITDSPVYGSQLFAESRLKSFYPAHSGYPYTIKFDYEISRSNIISYEYWLPVPYYNISVEHSAFNLVYPPRIIIKEKEIGIKGVGSEIHKDYIKEGWEVANLKAIEEEPYSISFYERVPAVYLMPSVLIYEKYEGKADDWSDCGKWFYSLYKGRDEISDPEKLKIDAIIKNIPDTLGRIRSLYKYMQENTRYVAITIGLGGYQPFDAKTVFETGYGECKALSNYLHSLLKYAGIKSYPAWVSSGRYKEPIFTDFPNFQQFDHSILCVPFKPDTLWLECTDQKMPFGFLGDFTDDRDVLLITEQGGKFAHTTKYDAKENIRSCRSEFNVDSIGAAECNLTSYHTGLQYDEISGLLRLNFEEQKKWLYSSTSLPSLQIKKFSISESTNMLPSAKISESVVSKNYCSFSGKYMVLPLNLINVQSPVQKMLKSRKSDILISRSSIEYDTMIYRIPVNYKYESVPAGNTINSIFGSYSCTVSVKENEIVFIRKLTLLEGRYKPENYKQLYDFILSVSKADNTKILLTKS